MIYRVRTKEVWCQDVLVEANNEKEAVEKAVNCDGTADENSFIFDHMLDTESWEVELDNEA